MRFAINVLLLLLLIVNISFVQLLKTSVPDEVIRILNGNYNKHHLPTQISFDTNQSCDAKEQRKFQIRKTTELIVEYRKSQTNNEQTIRFVQKIDEASNVRRVTRVTMSLMAAQDVLKNLNIILDQKKKLRHKADLKNSVLGTQTIISLETNVDAMRRHQLDLVQRSDALELDISELRRPARRQWVVVPDEFIQNVTTSIGELLQCRHREAEVAEPTEVTIGMYIEGMSSFRAQTMDFHLDIYFNEMWVDPRLRHSSEYAVLVKDSAIFDKMWQPDLYFANAKDAKYHTVTAPNYFMWIHPNGTVYLDVRVTLVVNCMMDLQEYPLDTQECNVRILSYAYDIDNLNITWREVDDIAINCEIRLADMELVAYGATKCNGVYAIGEWACALASFKMKRYKMHHVLQSYIPTALIVVISWFSFWLDVDAVPGRVSLCITTLLTLATQSQAAKMSLPQVSYAKAIDIWMGVCMAFVFGVMIEFTAVNYLARTQLSNKKTAPSQNSRRKRNAMRTVPEFRNLLFDNIPNHVDVADRETCVSTVQSTSSSEVSKGNSRKSAIRVDNFCRTGFPVSFLIFNICYWSYYLSISRKFISKTYNNYCPPE